MVFHPIKKLNHPRTSHPPRRAIFPASGKVSATSEPSPSCQPHIPALFVQKRRGGADYYARARFGTCCTTGATISGATMIRALLVVPLILPLTSEEHTSEPQTLMRISYAVFCLKTKNRTTQ